MITDLKAAGSPAKSIGGSACDALCALVPRSLAMVVSRAAAAAQTEPIRSHRSRSRVACAPPTVVRRPAGERAAHHRLPGFDAAQPVRRSRPAGRSAAAPPPACELGQQFFIRRTITARRQHRAARRRDARLGARRRGQRIDGDRASSITSAAASSPAIISSRTSTPVGVAADYRAGRDRPASPTSAPRARRGRQRGPRDGRRRRLRADRLGPRLRD